MRRLVLITLLLSLSFAQYTLNLEKKSIARPGATAYEDILHYTKVSFNTDNNLVNTLLDTTSAESWRIVPTSTGALPIRSVSGGISSETAAEVID